MFHIRELIALSAIPDVGTQAWLEDARTAVDFVVNNAADREVVLYASLNAVLIHGVLAPLAAVTPPDPADLAKAHVFPDATWTIEHTMGGGEPDRMYISNPMSNAGCRSLACGEKLIFRRGFHGVENGALTEISQRLVHSLGLHFVQELSAFCRLDEMGEIVPVVKIIVPTAENRSSSGVVVTISAADLHRYMAVSNMALVRIFDFTRVQPKLFAGWSDRTHFSHEDQNLLYHGCLQPSASYAHGCHILRPLITKAELIEAEHRKFHRPLTDYATFKAQDWKNGRLAELSCAPEALASYFEKDSPLPFQITPAFFRPEVLSKYKSDPDKYTLEHRSITCRGGWHLETYDINEAGQVHTYLRYLGYLPYEEQLYWKAFNEWPKAPISGRAFQTDFEGNFPTDYDPLMVIKVKLEALDRSPPDWWMARGEELYRTLHYPVTTSVEEWSNAILALDQAIVEGFRVKSVRGRLDGLKCSYDKKWGSIRLIEEYIVATGVAREEATASMEPLKRLHYLRSVLKGHAATAERKAQVNIAKAEHGSLKEHFRSLAADCEATLARIQAALESPNEPS